MFLQRKNRLWVTVSDGSIHHIHLSLTWSHTLNTRCHVRLLRMSNLRDERCRGGLSSTLNTGSAHRYHPGRFSAEERPFSIPDEVQPLSSALYNLPPEPATSRFYQPENRGAAKKYEEWIGGSLPWETTDHWLFGETCWVACVSTLMPPPSLQGDAWV